MGPSGNRPVKKTCLLQHLNMLGGSGKRHFKGGCELRYRSLMERHEPDHFSSRRIGESVKNIIELIAFLFNHTVNYKRKNRNIQPYGLIFLFCEKQAFD